MSRAPLLTVQPGNTGRPDGTAASCCCGLARGPPPLGIATCPGLGHKPRVAEMTMTHGVAAAGAAAGPPAAVRDQVTR